MNTQLRERLSSLKLDIDAETTSRHLAEVARALKSAPPAPRRRRRFGVRLAPVMAVLALFVAPATGVAIAAESSVPGDVLFPVKGLTEDVRAWFDPGIVVDHRLEEAEALLDRDAPDAAVLDRLDAADRALERLDADRVDVFSVRLEQVRARYADRVTDASPVDDGRQDAVRDEPVDERTVDSTAGPARTDTGQTDVTSTTVATDARTGAEPTRDEPVRDTTTTTTTMPPDERESDGRDGDDRPPGDRDG